MLQWLKNLFGKSEPSVRISMAEMLRVQSDCGDPTLDSLYLHFGSQGNNPTNIKALKLIITGLKKNQAGDPTGALQDLDQVATLPWVDLHLRQHTELIRGIVKISSKNLQGAIADLTSFLEYVGMHLDDDKDWAMLWRGRARLQIGEIEQAKVDFERVANSKNLRDIPRLLAIKNQAEQELQQLTK